jgi:hypothetical protein
MASNPKSILFFLFVLTLISTNNSFESNRFLEDKNVFENIFKKKERRQSIVQKLTDIKKFNENQEEKNLFLNIFSKKKKDKNDPPSPPKNVPAPPQNEPAPLKNIETTNKEKLIDRDIENSIIDDDNMEKPLYIQDSFDNLFSNEKNFSKKLINVKCFWVNDFDIYSLEKLSTDKGYNVNEGENEALFSLCKNLKDKDTMFLLNNKTKAAGSIENYSKWDKNSDNLTILLPEGEICDETKKINYTVKLIFECDDDDSADIDDEKENFENNLKLNVNGCEIEVTSKTVYACPLNNYYIFERIFKKYKIPSVIFICLMGLFLAFFGAKVLKVTVLLLGALVFCVVALSAVYSVFSISNENTMLIVMAVAFCIGLALGFLLLKLVKLFIVILGGACGYTLGLAVYAILKDKDLNIEEDHLYYGTLVVCILLCALISLCLVKHALIFGTSIIGGYLVIKGISLVLGHLPNESRIVDLIKKKEFDQLDEILKDDKALYYYLGWLVIIIIGVCVQYRNNKDKKKKDKLLK